MVLGLIDGFKDFISTAQNAVTGIKSVFELFLSVLNMIINFFPTPFKEILLIFSVIFGGVIIFKIVGNFL